MARKLAFLAALVLAPAMAVAIQNSFTVNSGEVETMTRWEWNNCGEPTDAIQIKSLKVSPDPPKPGHNLTIHATGTAQELVDEGAYADVVVKLGLIKLLTKRFDVCEELLNANATLQCPIQPDEYEITQTVELPAEIPRAKFVVSVRAFTQDDHPMACIDLSINFLLPDPLQRVKTTFAREITN